MRVREVIGIILLMVLVQTFTVVLVSVIQPGTGGWSTVVILILGMSAVAGSIAIGLVVALRRYEAARAANIALMTLAEDERRVFEAIVQAGGQAYQDKLRRELDMSKSKLSALVHNLERKHAITKERYFRTNVLRASKEFARR